MMCVFCGKPMDKVMHWVAGHPVGPKCYAKRFGKMQKTQVTATDQPDLFGETMSYADLELKVVRWGEDRKIVQNSNCLAQAKKTIEECYELLEAIEAGDKEAQKDAYGDILVTLIIGCATADFDLVECLALAYDEIKDRKGYLTEDGTFVKVTA